MASGAHRNLPFREEMHARERIFRLSPGSGLHVPVYCPHWVRVDADVSISFSVTFRSRVSLRRDAVLRFNSRLRRGGLDPTMPGRRVLNDELKYFAERVLKRFERNRPTL
jgi:hypothetical protein